MTKIRYLLLIPVFALLAGCVQHLSQEQCLNMNWYNEGFNDGVAGKMPRNLAPAITDCAKYNILVNGTTYQSGWHEGARKYCRPDYSLGYTDGIAGKSMNDINSRMPVCAAASVHLRLEDYKSGWQKGIASFCTPDNATLLGQQGKPLPDVCPASLQAGFTAGWNKGKDQFCNQTGNAFALGKENKSYPDACTPALYVSFKSEYDRGAAIGQRMKDIKAQIKSIDDNISGKVNQYGFTQNNGTYQLGSDKSNDAVAALSQVNAWIAQEQPLKDQLFNLQVMK